MKEVFQTRLATIKAFQPREMVLDGELLDESRLAAGQAADDGETAKCHAVADRDVGQRVAPSLLIPGMCVCVCATVCACMRMCVDSCVLVCVDVGKAHMQA